MGDGVSFGLGGCLGCEGLHTNTQLRRRTGENGLLRCIDCLLAGRLVRGLDRGLIYPGFGASERSRLSGRGYYSIISIFEESWMEVSVAYKLGAWTRPSTNTAR